MKKLKKIFIIIMIEIIIVTLSICNIFMINFNENQLMYISSTMAQVASTLFGLIITGFIFYEDKLNKQVDEDESLLEINENLKIISRKYLIEIGILNSFVVIICICNIFFGYNVLRLYKLLFCLLIYNGIFFFFWEIGFVFYFVMKVTDPNKVKKISEKNMKLMDSEKIQTTKDIKKSDMTLDNKNHFFEFLQNYNELERIILEYPINNYKGKMLISDKLKMLLVNKKISESLYGEIQSIRKYRNYAVHSNKPTINEFQNELLKKILYMTEDELNLKHNVGYKDNLTI